MSRAEHDLPFEPNEVAHIARRLHALGIKPDREWLAAPFSLNEMVIFSSHDRLLEEAKKHIPTSDAQWELSEFFRYAIPGAAFDCKWLISYAAFEFLYRRILGEASRPWLPSLYLAAATLPSLEEHARASAVSTFNTGVFSDQD